MHSFLAPSAPKFAHSIPRRPHKRGQDSFGLVQSLDRRLCYTKKVLLDSSVERPDRIETCNQEEPLLEHSDTRLLAGTKLLLHQNCSTSSIHDLTDILVVDCLEMFAPQTHKLEWPTKALVPLRVRLRFCDTGPRGMLHKYHT